MRRRAIADQWRAEDRGTTAVEFAFVIPVFMTMLFGAINTAQLMGAMSGMHYAVEEAARCYAVNTTLCPTPTAARALALQKYKGPNVGIIFAATTAGCGHTVTATAQFNLDVMVSVFHIPLSATSCYPGVTAP